MASALLLIAFAFSNCGLPIPVFDVSNESDSSVAYPCQHSHCGCKSAHHCWTKCCCRSPQQRADWAKKHGVTPPSYAVLSEAPSSPEGDTPSEEVRVSALKDLIEKSTLLLLSCGVGAKSHPTDANKGLSAANKPHVAKVAANKQRFRLQILADECRGKSSEFSWLPWMSLAKLVPANIEDLELCRVIVLPRPILDSLEPSPDTPPPRA